MTAARDVLDPAASVLREEDTVVLAAQRLRDADVDALPVVDERGVLTGQLSTRDVVVTCVATGRDPAGTGVGECASPVVMTAEVGEPVTSVLRTMASHQVKWLPVVDGDRLVGTTTSALVTDAVRAGRAG